MLTVLLCALVCGCARAQPVDARGTAACDLPVIMYHSVLKDPARTGKYVVTPQKLESDVAWLLKNGYTIVTADEVIEFAGGRGLLPERPVLLTFDDGYLNNLTYVLPILEKYDCTAVVAIVGAYTERYSAAPDPNPNYAYVSWGEAYELVLSGRVELANHTYDMHGQQGRMGAARKKGESEADYRAAFIADVGRLQGALGAHTHTTPALFAYPFGVVDHASRAMLREMGFAGSLTCRERVSRIVFGDPETLWELGRFNRAGELSTEAFMQKIGLWRRVSP